MRAYYSLCVVKCGSLLDENRKKHVICPSPEDKVILLVVKNDFTVQVMLAIFLVC